MTVDEFLDKQYHLSVTAGMNQRYHQSLASMWGLWDRGFRIAVGIFTAAGAMLSIAAANSPSGSLLAASITVAVVAAILGVILNILPIADWERHCSDLFRRWSDFREDVDALEFEISHKVSPAMIIRLRQLDGKLHRICGMEARPNRKLLNECYQQEVDSRQFAGSVCQSLDTAAV